MSARPTYWEWTSPKGGPRLLVQRPALEALLKIARRSEAVNEEMGGFLAGLVRRTPEGWVLVVEAVLPVEGSRATQQEFTFRAEDFARQYHDYPVDAEVPAGLTTLGWYHTHPGHGVFFSQPDQATHREKFGHPFQCGLVLDPTRNEGGVCYWMAPDTFGPTELGKVATFDLNRLPARPLPAPPVPPEVYTLGAGMLAGLMLVGTLVAGRLPASTPGQPQRPADLELSVGQDAYVVPLRLAGYRYQLAPEGTVPSTFIPAGRTVTVSYREPLLRDRSRLWLKHGDELRYLDLPVRVPRDELADHPRWLFDIRTTASAARPRPTLYWAVERADLAATRHGPVLVTHQVEVTP